jgi:thioredoxin-like negative regulator of GroEL
MAAQPEARTQQGRPPREAAAAALRPRRARPASERAKLVLFYSATSGRSRRVEGFLAQVLQRRRNHDTFRILRVDSDERPDLLERFQVTRTPTLLVIEGNRVRGRLTEPKGCRDIKTLLEPWLNG